MIHLNFNLRLPKWYNRFENIKCWFGNTPIKNKYWEIQIIKNDNLFRFEFEYTIRQHHAGINLELGLFGYEIHATIYDNRHWNYEKEYWENHD